VNRVITVLQVLGGLEVGGAESRVMDITRNLNQSKVRYAFLVHDKGPDYYEKEAEELGCAVYRVPRFCFFNYFAYVRAMKKFFAEQTDIDIVQGHITSSAAIYLPIAKKAGVKVTIAHARSAGVDPGMKGFLTRLLRRHLGKKCDQMWACSTEAAIAVYGRKTFEQKQVTIIHNAINVDQFKSTALNCSAGEEIRRKYGLENRFVVGHVGRFHYAKNHEFLIGVFAQILQQKENAVLLLVGEGSRMNEMKELTKELGIEQQVIFAGRQTKPSDYYHAMDLLVFPSRYEGLPGTIVEAQAAGLPCLVSDRVTKDVGVTELVEYESLDSSAKVWAEKGIALALKTARKKATGDLIAPELILRKEDFDVTMQVKRLEQLYQSLMP